MNNLQININSQKKIKEFVFLSAMMLVIIFLLFVQIRKHDFIRYDDYQYIVENQNVNRGLNFNNIIWAFSSISEANWHPLTWISHMFDCEFFGLDAGKHHLMNLFFHMINVLLVFLFSYLIFLKRENAVYLSFFIAFIFAVHPQRIESVAWASERKDVLSSMFFFLTIIFYWVYLNNKSKTNHNHGLYTYSIMVICYCFGLLSKPMLVTVPFVLMLIDFLLTGKVTIKNKIILFVLAVISSLVTVYAQLGGGAVRTIMEFSLEDRIFNVFISYCEYLIRYCFPFNLSFFYQYPNEGFSFYKIALSILTVCSISFYLFIKRNSIPFVFSGWFFFLITLVPVIGIVQVGYQLTADRYMYIPSLGLNILVVRVLFNCFTISKIPNIIRYMILSGFVFALVMLTNNELKYWKNSYTLFSRALEVSNNNFMAHNSLGAAFFHDKKYDDAEFHFKESIKYFAKNYKAHNNLSEIYFIRKEYPKAIWHLNKSIGIKNNDFKTHQNLGVAYFKNNEFLKAIISLKKAVELKPFSKDAHFNLGLIYLKTSQHSEALKEYELLKQLDIDIAKKFKIIMDKNI